MLISDNEVSTVSADCFQPNELPCPLFRGGHVTMIEMCIPCEIKVIDDYASYNFSILENCCKFFSLFQIMANIYVLALNRIWQ